MMLRNRRWPTAVLSLRGTRSSATESRRSDLTELIGELGAYDARNLELAGVEVNRNNSSQYSCRHPTICKTGSIQQHVVINDTYPFPSLAENTVHALHPVCVSYKAVTDTPPPKCC